MNGLKTHTVHCIYAYLPEMDRDATIAEIAAIDPTEFARRPSVGRATMRDLDLWLETKGHHNWINNWRHYHGRVTVSWRPLRSTVLHEMG